MAYPDWKIHGEDTLAAYLPDSDFKGILEKRIAVAPDHLGLLIRDGQIVDSFVGGHFAVGGVWQTLKEAVGGKHALRFLVADLKPFSVHVPIGGFSKDEVEISAELTVEFQLNPERSQDIMGLVTNNSSLTRQDIFDRVHPHIRERVLMAEIVQHDASELRANAGLQDRLQAEIMKEVERVAGDLGLLVRTVSLNFATNAEEVQAVAMRTMEREDELCEVQHQRALRELERAQETTTFRIGTALEVEKAKAASDSELKRLFLSDELKLTDIRSGAERTEEIRRIEHDIDAAKRTRIARHEACLADASNDLDRKRIEKEIERLKREIDSSARQEEARLKEIESQAELKIAGSAWDLQQRKLKDLQNIEVGKSQAQHELAKDEHLTQHKTSMEDKQASSQAELEKLKLQATMTPDQLLAIQAGASPEVAKVFGERAKSEGGDKEALLREMLALSQQTKVESEQQARAMFERAVDRIADVGKAAGGSSHTSGGDSPNDHETKNSECPKCHHQVLSADRFCKICGHQMRT